MNERIQELVKQATEYDYTTWDSYNQKEVVHYKFNQQKFAELIIKDCISQIAIIGLSNEENEDISWAVDLAILNIKDRFDVK